MSVTEHKKNKMMAFRRFTMFVADLDPGHCSQIGRIFAHARGPFHPGSVRSSYHDTKFKFASLPQTVTPPEICNHEAV